jgi:hypothetical protein
MAAFEVTAEVSDDVVDTLRIIEPFFISKIKKVISFVMPN